MTCLLGCLGCWLFEEGNENGLCVVTKVSDEVSEAVIGRETKSNIYCFIRRNWYYTCGTLGL